ncbi:uncharacterized protein LOC125585922 [Brassica napus]|uniref:uncharacterized protein LOC125585922 n=1 Tax=Brassica napus TaxID=3708 RepID=UPI0020794E39|nr:uncharacterized protein LOC125585922 [Brassica napus]
MKIDISKAFDSVQWTFVLRSLEALGIPERFIRWIRLCITTPSFSVQVNGDLAGYFQSSRGLRQGCSLSPYLFVLCMNVLSLKIDQAVAEKKFKFHPRSGVSEVEEGRILSNFPFAKGELPVRYLGLPLMTKAMRKQDYFPLVEKIRGRIRPELKVTGAKVAWSVVCQTKYEGGLRIRALKVVNRVAYICKKGFSLFAIAES